MDDPFHLLFRKSYNLIVIIFRPMLNITETMSFARDFYAVYSPFIFGFIDLVLDHPLRVGGTGWDKIRQMAKK